MDKILQFLDVNKIDYKQNIDLKTKTWIKTGGVASVWIIPSTVEQLEDLGIFLYKNNVDFEIVGYTSNIFFKRDYNPNVIISTIKLKKYSIDGNKVICDCGVSISTLSKSFAKIGYSGFYGLVDLPGTIAAAIYNNAGCFDCMVSSHLGSVRFLNSQGKIETLEYKDLDFSHRSTILKEKRLQGIILQVTLNVEMSALPSKEAVKVEEVHAKRIKQQEGPVKNLGSVHSRFEKRKNIRNLIIRIINKIHRLTPKQHKTLILFLYRYSYLDKYISDKSLNTFIWYDDNAEQMFDAYSLFIHKAHSNVIVEIEVKDGN